MKELILAAALAATACSSSSGGGTSSSRDAGGGSPEAGDRLGGFDASADAATTCTVPPAANSPRDAASGCTSYPGVFGNGVDVCNSSEYGLSCLDEQAPASLQCRDLGLPTPQGVLIYCCPCMP